MSLTCVRVLGLCVLCETFVNFVFTPSQSGQGLKNEHFVISGFVVKYV
jgi:hypothetical protein